MKLAVNTFLITMVTGLAEAGHFAARHGLAMDRFAEILNAKEATKTKLINVNYTMTQTPAESNESSKARDVMVRAC